MTLPLILCIDDDPISIKLLKSFLCEQFRISTALSAQDGLELIKNERPDLIISDVLMPDMNGFEIISKLRESPETAKIPFIFISSLAQLSNIGTSERSGIPQFFTKPIDHDHLLDSIKRLLSKD
ncbi:MAG: response regulator [Chromatiales bacterium]|nr:response regulator [Chromatiales bacterium]